MVEIITRRHGPRREDVDARTLISNNRGVIDRLADHLTGGGYSASRKIRAGEGEPEPSGTIIHVVGTRSTGSEPRPYVRISPNNRVVVVDQENGRQMHHLGDVRRFVDGRRFVLATAANGYFAPLAAEIADAVVDLDHTAVDDADGEAHLVTAIKSRLGIA